VKRKVVTPEDALAKAVVARSELKSLLERLAATPLQRLLSEAAL